MPNSTKLYEVVGILTKIIEKDSGGDITHLIAPLSPPEIARTIESLPSSLRIHLWKQISLDKLAEVLLEVHIDTRRQLIKLTEPERLIESLSVVQMDELADLDDDLPTAGVNG